MRPKFLLLAAAFIAGSTAAHAQKRTITFESTNSSSRGNSRHHQREDAAKNSVTVGILSWFNGYVPVHFEHAVAKFLSLQVGAGVTFHGYGNDFGELVYDEGSQNVLFNNSSQGYIDVKEYYYSSLFRNARPGYYASFSPKLYFRGNVMNGFTLSPVVEYKRFNYAAQTADITPGLFPETEEEDIPRAGTMKEHTNCLDLMLGIGGHYQAGHHITVAWSMGFGIRNMSASRLDIGYYTDPVSAQQYYVNREREFKTVRPLLTFDLRIGRWF